jgi:hypothetical protein
MIKVAAIPNNGFTHLVDVFDMMTEFLRPLPFDEFRRLVLHLNLPPKEYAAILANAILPLLAHPPTRINVLEITQSDLVHHFLPFRANSHNVVDSAKMSLLIERLIMTLGSENQLEINDVFVNEVLGGIQAREVYAIGDDYSHIGRASKNKSDDEANQDELRNSGMRISSYIKMLQGMMNRYQTSMLIHESASVEPPGPEREKLITFVINWCKIYSSARYTRCLTQDMCYV